MSEKSLAFGWLVFTFENRLAPRNQNNAGGILDQKIVQNDVGVRTSVTKRDGVRDTVEVRVCSLSEISHLEYAFHLGLTKHGD